MKDQLKTIREFFDSISVPYETLIAFEQLESMVAVPPGYVLVPVEPTEAMLLSARDWSATKYGKPIGNDAAKGCWGAMVAAAIAQQKGDQ